MTISTPVERRRLFARRALLSLSTILCSGLSAPAFAEDLVPPKVNVTTPGGINIADGSFVYSVTDLSIGTISLERFQVTGPKVGTTRPAKPHLSLSMTDNFDIYVASNIHAGTKSPNQPARYLPIVHLGASASGTYQEPANGSSILPWNKDALSGSLTLVNGNYVYTDKDGTVYCFSAAISAGLNSPSQRVSNIVYADGRVRNFEYVGSANQLKRVSDSSGYAIVFDYDGSGNVSAACGFDSARTFTSTATTCGSAAFRVSYSHDSSGSLTGVTDVLGQVTSYTEVPWGITCIQPPGFSQCRTTINYNLSGNSSHYVQQRFIDGSEWDVVTGDASVVDGADHVPDSDCGEQGSVRDPSGQTTYYNFTNTSPCVIQDANGNSTNYQFIGSPLSDYFSTPYHAGGLLSNATLPDGNSYSAVYNGPFNAVTSQTWKAKPGSGLQDITVTYDYDDYQTLQSIAKPIKKVDANQNETDWAYTGFGAPLWELQPPPASGAARPLKLYSYAQKYAWIQDSNGNMTQAATPIWLPATETMCQTVAGFAAGQSSSAPTCDSGAPQVTTTYEYGADGTADNLLLRGKVVSADGQSLRTCYRYDARSNKVAETSPRAGVSSCPS